MNLSSYCHVSQTVEAEITLQEHSGAHHSLSFYLLLLATKSRLSPTWALYQSSTVHFFSQQQVWIKNLPRAPTVSPCDAALTCDIKGSKQLLRNICQYVSTVAFIMIKLHISCSPCCLPYHLRLLPFFVSSRITKTKYKLLFAVQLCHCFNFKCLIFFFIFYFYLFCQHYSKAGTSLGEGGAPAERDLCRLCTLPVPHPAG